MLNDDDDDDWSALLPTVYCVGTMDNMICSCSTEVDIFLKMIILSAEEHDV